MSGATLEEGDFTDAELDGTNLQRAVLRRGTFIRADLSGADLREAVLLGANLTAAVMREAGLTGLAPGVQTGRGVFRRLLAGPQPNDRRPAWRTGRGGGGRPVRRRPPGVFVLERNFESLGDPDAASWAYRRKRRMEKWACWVAARDEWRAGRRVSAARQVVRFGNLQFVELLCDYGEGIPRTLASIGVLFLVFVVMYGLTGSVLRKPPGTDGVMTRSPLDLATFSLLTMAQLDTGQAGWSRPTDSPTC